MIVPLFIDQNFNPDFTVMEKAIRSLGKILKKGDLVVVETTFPPGSTDAKIKSWLEESSGLGSNEFHLAYSPERIMTGYSISRLREFPKVIGGTDEESGLLAYEVYRKFISNLHLVSSAKVAEMIKVMEGCYRDVNIALANELFKIAEELGIDFYEARAYANHDYCHIHLPSTGVGGHCIPVYPWFLIKEMLSREKPELARLLMTSRDLNDSMAEYWASKMLLECLKIDKPLSEIKICIRGITYRKGTTGIFHSRNLAMAKLLMKKGFRAGAWDELLSTEEIEKLGLSYMDPDEADIVFDSFGLKIEVENKIKPKIKLP